MKSRIISPYRREFLFIPPEGRVALPAKPNRLWTIIPVSPDQPDPSLLEPGTPLVHHGNGFIEDHVHDWVWGNGVLKYFSRVSVGNCWVVLEYDEVRHDDFRFMLPEKGQPELVFSFSKQFLKVLTREDELGHPEVLWTDAQGYPEDWDNMVPLLQSARSADVVLFVSMMQQWKYAPQVT